MPFVRRVAAATKRISGWDWPGHARQMSDEMGHHWGQVDTAEVLDELQSLNH
jgi:hypothetical protein